MNERHFNFSALSVKLGAVKPLFIQQMYKKKTLSKIKLASKRLLYSSAMVTGFISYYIP